MQSSRTNLLFFCWMAFGFSGMALAGDSEARPGSLRAEPVTAKDLAELGVRLDAYKFRLTGHDARQFRLILRVTAKAGAEPRVPFEFAFERPDDDPLELLLLFLPERSDGSGVLASDGPLRLRVVCRNCKPDGTTTTIPHPLADVATPERFITVQNRPRSDHKSTAARPDEMTLIRLFRVERSTTGAEPSYPRAEIVLVPEPLRE